MIATVPSFGSLDSVRRNFAGVPGGEDGPRGRPRSPPLLHLPYPRPLQSAQRVTATGTVNPCTNPYQPEPLIPFVSFGSPRWCVRPRCGWHIGKDGIAGSVFRNSQPNVPMTHQTKIGVVTESYYPRGQTIPSAQGRLSDIKRGSGFTSPRRTSNHNSYAAPVANNGNPTGDFVPWDVLGELLWQTGGGRKMR
eukprot:2978151-Pyramimonas_sp.AAC.2